MTKRQGSQREAGRGRKQVESAQRRQLAALRAAFEGVGVHVDVTASVDGRGGACTVRGRRWVILPGRLPMAERLERLAEMAPELGVAPEAVPEALRGLVTRAEAAAP